MCARWAGAAEGANTEQKSGANNGCTYVGFGAGVPGRASKDLETDISSDLFADRAVARRRGTWSPVNALLTEVRRLKLTPHAFGATDMFTMFWSISISINTRQLFVTGFIFPSYLSVNCFFFSLCYPPRAIAPTAVTLLHQYQTALVFLSYQGALVTKRTTTPNIGKASVLDVLIYELTLLPIVCRRTAMRQITSPLG